MLHFVESKAHQQRHPVAHASVSILIVCFETSTRFTTSRINCECVGCCCGISSLFNGHFIETFLSHKSTASSPGIWSCSLWSLTVNLFSHIVTKEIIIQTPLFPIDGQMMTIAFNRTNNAYFPYVVSNWFSVQFDCPKLLTQLYTILSSGHKNGAKLDDKYLNVDYRQLEKS